MEGLFIQLSDDV